MDHQIGNHDEQWPFHPASHSLAAMEVTGNMPWPGTLYLLHGMKRSGNHAIVNWLVPQLGCEFFNNLIPVGDILRGHPWPQPIPFESWRRKQSGLARQAGTSVLATLEDHELSVLPFTAIDVPVCRLLVLRHPEQLFSSRLRKAFNVDMPAYPRTNDVVLQRAVGIWKQHARCYLGGDVGYPDRIAILFDAWVADAEYRAGIATALGAEFNDVGFGRVSEEGGGSSFDSTRFDGRGQLMNVADRVSSLASNELALLQEIFADAELQDLQRAVSKADPLMQLR